jgi:hypothetical protein
MQRRFGTFIAAGPKSPDALTESPPRPLTTLWIHPTRASRNLTRASPRFTRLPCLAVKRPSTRALVALHPSAKARPGHPFGVFGREKPQGLFPVGTCSRRHLHKPSASHFHKGYCKVSQGLARDRFSRQRQAPPSLRYISTGSATRALQGILRGGCSGNCSLQAPSTRASAPRGAHPTTEPTGAIDKAL